MGGLGEKTIWFLKAVGMRVAVTAVGSLVWLGIVCAVLTWIVTGGSLGDSVGSVLEGFGRLAWVVARPVVLAVIFAVWCAVMIAWVFGRISFSQIALAILRRVRAAAGKALRLVLGEYYFSLVAKCWHDYSQEGLKGFVIAWFAAGVIVIMFDEHAPGGGHAASWISQHVWGWVFVAVAGVFIIGGLIFGALGVWVLLRMLCGKQSRWAETFYHPYGTQKD
jgi:hypothetical protein